MLTESEADVECAKGLTDGTPAGGPDRRVSPEAGRRRIAGEPQLGGFGTQDKHETAISPDGTRMHLGAFPQTLEVVKLEDDGMPGSNEPEIDAKATPDGANQSYFRFLYTGLKFYHWQPSVKVRAWSLVAWPLDANGLLNEQRRTSPRIMHDQLLRPVGLRGS